MGVRYETPIGCVLDQEGPSKAYHALVFAALVTLRQHQGIQNSESPSGVARSNGGEGDACNHR